MNTNRSLAALLLGVKALLGGWAGLVLVTTSPTHVRSFLGNEVHNRHTGLGVLILGLALATLLIAVALIRWSPASVPAAFAIEAVGMVLALTRVNANPGPAALSLALSGAVVVLLATSLRETTPPGRVRHFVARPG